MRESTTNDRPRLPRDVVLVSTADWDNPHWTNKQHLAVRLGARGMRVLYLESLGLRRPQANPRDVIRSLRRLWRGLCGARRPSAGVWVVSPLQIPLNQSEVVRRVNRGLLSAQVRLHCGLLGFDRPMLWLFNPLAAALKHAVDPALVVYQCVDELAASPGMPGEVIEQAERALLEQADAVIVTSRPLFERRRATARRILLSENAVDFAHFASKHDAPNWLAEIPRPRLGYVGAISGYKVDLELLGEVALRHPDWHFVLVGTVGEGDPNTDVGSLSSLPNVHFARPQPFSELPGILQGLDACLLPSRINEYTGGMFPMKFFEYCASGRPIVSTPLPALRRYWSLCYVGSTPVEFADAVTSALTEGSHMSAARQDVARSHDWEARVDAMLAFVAGAPEPV